MGWADENARAASRDGRPRSGGGADAPASGATAADSPAADAPKTAFPPTLVFLGTGAACGVPTYYCDCKACREARANPRAARSCSGIAVLTSASTTLIDATPDVHRQLERESLMDVDRVLFTHEHFDHVGGVPQLEYYVRLRRRDPLPFYANPQTASYLKTKYDFMDDTFTLDEAQVGKRMEFDGIGYTPVAASHCPGALGYVIDVAGGLSSKGRAMRVGYMPDTSRPPAETLDALSGVDVLIIDATFNGGNWMPTQHLDIDSAVALADELGVGRAYLTHLSMQFDEPITARELDAKLEGSRARAAYDGLRIEM